MFAMHNDVKRLIEFSIEDNLESAIALFPMFSPQQIRGLYDISISQRVQLLHGWGVEDRPRPTSPPFPRSSQPGPGREIRQQAADPSNR